ncbi:Type IV inositol polyphosphate 5-phosphatase 3 [Sesamum angolense]|uniref:Type IV inositol polyphosphate 5-phosphatase 3 n=1 Tax=Sesamum angolense TaxID=2727404 RepID=A0AAE2BPJ0_9LAMI|nr:Type IV inositol polyphosphate 5-phosphatase 3 [Sesamum angolense]
MHCNNELRIFVGTWNVAGRSPVGSLDVDLDEWLNLRDAADIYVLGLQEIVPLKATTVIGVEDPTEATNWNLLIGKTLNNRYGLPMANTFGASHHQ